MIRARGLILLMVVVRIAGGLGTDSATAEDFQVNTYTSAYQLRTSVAVAADGRFVVVWESQGSSGTDSSGRSVQGQRFAADGSPAGGEFQINTSTIDYQRLPAVAMTADGDFVVIWHGPDSAGTDQSADSIQGQRYASGGTTVGGEFQVNTYTTSGQFVPAVAMGADGGFVVVWHSFGSAGTDSSALSVQGQRFAADGAAAGGEFQVNTYTTDSQRYPSVAVGGDGGFFVVWFSDGSSGTDSSSTSIQGQRYASGGTALGGEFQVNTYTLSAQVRPSVAMAAAGDAVVAWTSSRSDGTDFSLTSIQGQRYAAGGTAAGDQFQVNTYISGSQQAPSVAVAADGDFIVMWHSPGSSGTDSSDASIQGQRYASSGLAVGGEFQVNTYTSDNQYNPSVVLDTEGNFVVAWESFGSGGTDTSGYSVQRAAVAPIFADGFESGDTSAWSNSVSGSKRRW